MVKLFLLIVEKLTRNNPELKQEIKNDFREWVKENKMEHLFCKRKDSFRPFDGKFFPSLENFR